MAFEKDRRLVACILAGEGDAVAQFISNYRPFACAILTRHLKLSPPDADEVFQRFIFRIWEDGFRRLRDWSGNTSLDAYLARIVRNLAHDYRRETRFLSDQFLDRAVDDTELARVDSRVLLESALRQLSLRDQDLLERRYVQGQSYEEIAEALGGAPNAIGVALSRAKDRLRTILRTFPL